MNSANFDLSIFRKFDFEITPVGIKFVLTKPGAYYAWTKDFIEAGKERLTRVIHG